MFILRKGTLSLEIVLLQDLNMVKRIWKLAQVLTVETVSDWGDDDGESQV